MLTRILCAVAGLGILVGFFLPWVVLGRLAAVSGFGLVLTSGELVDMIAGWHRLMLFAVPVLGAALLASAIFRPGIVTWVAALSGLSLLLFGLVTLVSLFVSTTGAGMWVVVGSCLLALSVGLINVGSQRRA